MKKLLSTVDCFETRHMAFMTMTNLQGASPQQQIMAVAVAMLEILESTGLDAWEVLEIAKSLKDHIANAKTAESRALRRYIDNEIVAKLGGPVGRHRHLILNET